MNASTINELHHLETELEIKGQLMKELKKKDKQLAIVRSEYEQKTADLSSKIATMEKERDRILKELATKPNTDEKIRKVEQDYEKRISLLRNDYNKLKGVEKQHVRLQAQQVRQKEELQSCLDEIQKMKRIKVSEYCHFSLIA
jgi:hypothetical protein